MFAALAPKLRRKGWRALIPIVPGEKRPAVAGWERCNRLAPNERQLDSWAKTRPEAGVGLAYGPDGVVGIDLDFTDGKKAAHALSISEETLGRTPMVRIGKAPKSMLFYRAAQGLSVPGKSFGGFEIYSTSGQTVLYGIHPGAGRPYHWPDESPETLAPQDLPIVAQNRLDAFVTRMTPLREDNAALKDGLVTNTGTTTTWLRVFARLATPEEMIEAGCTGMRGVGAGARHYTMQAVVTALVMRGVASSEFTARVEEAYAQTLTPGEALARRSAVRAAVRWANKKVWGNAADIEPVKLRVDW